MSAAAAPPVGRETVAVIGSGIAGLTAAWLLQRRYDVSLYEADDRLGGHSHTHDVPTPDAGTLPVDSGFIVHNRRTYPLLCRLFDALGVETQPTEMSMSVRCDGCGLEYAGARGLQGLVTRPRSLVRGRYLRLLSEVPRFHRRARMLLAEDDGSTTLADFLRREQFSPYFVSHFVVPLVGCVWSASQADALRYPARSLFTFLANHGMLSVTGSPQWRTVVGGSRSYVELAVKELTSVHVASPVVGVRRTATGVEVREAGDDAVHFDRVVIATHADQALAMLADPTAAETRVLGSFGYSDNPAVLHTDRGLLPRSPRAAASWNYLMPGCDTDSGAVTVTYDMGRLQSLPTAMPLLVSLNAEGRIRDQDVIERMHYTHPIFTPESVAAQAELPSLNSDRTAFAGAHHGWGFHEDGCRSGVRAASAFGVAWPGAVL
jgi:predicted NAD/FAD-binding protein